MSTTYDPWADEAEAEEPKAREAYSRPKDGESTYTWAGKEYPRVTDILGMAPGPHLMAWSAKVAALRAAAPLIHAGLFTPDVADATMAELEHFVDAEAIRVLEAADAIRDACNWASNMREAERYRDHRARIGSLAHHALYDHALGLRVAAADRIDYLCAKAQQLKLIPDTVVERYAAYGKDVSSIEIDLAHHAIPHWDSGIGFIEKLQPDFQAIGLESAVINTAEEYAGTDDWFATFKQSVWEKAGVHWPFGGVTATIAGDWKTGKESRSHRLQVAAYARAEFIGLMTDQTEHPVPEVDGICIVYTQEGAEAKFRTFVGSEKIDTYFEAFCGLNAYYRIMHDLPPATRARKFVAKKPRKGERECPI